MYYWELILFDGTTTLIPPAASDLIKKRWDDGQPIHLSTGSVPANQIKSFKPTDKPFTQTKLIEDVSQAFNEPLLNNDGSIVFRWVKKAVTREKYNKHYSNVPSYRFLNDDGMVTIAFRLPVHMIEQTITPYCDEQEIKVLTQGK